MKRSTQLCLAAVAALAIGLTPVPAAAGGGCHSPDPTEGSGQTVRLSQNCMSPTVLNAEEGEVTFLNDDPVLHNVTGSGMFEDLPPGESYARRFTSGTYPFSCTLHPGMNGVLVVGDGGGVAEKPAAVTPIAASPAAASSSGDASSNALVTIAAAVAAGLIAATGGFAMGRRRQA